MIRVEKPRINTNTIIQITENSSPTTLDKSETKDLIYVSLYSFLTDRGIRQLQAYILTTASAGGRKHHRSQRRQEQAHGQVWVTWPPWSSSQEHCHPRLMAWVGESEENQKVFPTERRTGDQQAQRINTTSNRSHKWELSIQEWAWEVSKAVKSRAQESLWKPTWSITAAPPPRGKGAWHVSSQSVFP